MRVLNINTVRKFFRSNGKRDIIQPKRQEFSQFKDALCTYNKEYANYYYGYPKYYWGNKAYNIELLISSGKGSGTRAVKKVLQKSLSDSETQGRVTLTAANLKVSSSHPFLFYYKLGFRSGEEVYNAYGEKGLNIPYPNAMFYMFMPKENIKQCLNYKIKSDVESSGFKYYYGKIKR